MSIGKRSSRSSANSPALMTEYKRMYTKYSPAERRLYWVQLSHLARPEYLAVEAYLRGVAEGERDWRDTWRPV
jgi:hypothetical protein